MAQQLSQNKIIYLDQNWLSEMTKAVRFEASSRVDKGYFTELYNVILSAIAEDKLVCPTSTFHELESNLSHKLSIRIRSVAKALSRGLSFDSNVAICDTQLLQAALKFAGSESSAERQCKWSLPFNRDPDIPHSAFPQKRSGPEVYVTFPELVSEDRHIRREVTGPMYSEYKEAKADLNFPYRGDMVDFSRIQLFREAFFLFDDAKPILKKVLQDWGPDKEIAFQLRLRLFEKLCQICDKAGGIVDFLSSREFKAVHFLSIRAKLMAADIVNYGSRSPGSSLLTDYDIAATVVPYVDVFATESYLAELLRQTGVTNDYGCHVYTMRQKDELLDYLSRL